MLKYDKHLKQHARKLRLNMTDAEQKLWSRLRGKQFFLLQFYRQKPIGPYIVDFYAPQIQLVIEIDGSQHQDSVELQNDIVRDSYLKKHRLTILRFNNFEVLKNLEGVLEVIYQLVLKRGINPPKPPFSKGGW
jgi:very-short-patch-repair endonuclease